MGAVWTGLNGLSQGFTEQCRPPRWRTQWNDLEGAVQDLLYIGLTIVVFAALWLLLKGVERFER